MGPPHLWVSHLEKRSYSSINRKLCRKERMKVGMHWLLGREGMMEKMLRWVETTNYSCRWFHVYHSFFCFFIIYEYSPAWHDWNFQKGWAAFIELGFFGLQIEGVLSLTAQGGSVSLLTCSLLSHLLIWRDMEVPYQNQQLMISSAEKKTHSPWFT